MNSKFGRHSTRIQPAPKICISKKAEQGPSERTPGKTALITLQHPAYAIHQVPARAMTIFASSATSGIPWRGTATTPEGQQMTASIDGTLAAPIITIEDPRPSSPGIPLPWSCAMPPIDQVENYASNLLTAFQPLPPNPATITVMIS